MRKTYAFLFIVLLMCLGCQWRLKPNDVAVGDHQVSVARYDRIESLYLTTGDRAALQQMNTAYPMQTRTLIEDVLRIGKVDDPEINIKFLRFFQDSTLQSLISDVQQQYADMQDIDDDLSEAFQRLVKVLPALKAPQVYAQIGSFDQSIIVGPRTLGISLDKYLGADYPFYRDHYTDDQRRMMVRSMIVPDCLGFFILSHFPLPAGTEQSKRERDLHMGKIQWVVNQVTQRTIFKNDVVRAVERYMRRHGHQTAEQLLLNVSEGELTGAGA